MRLSDRFCLIPPTDQPSFRPFVNKILVTLCSTSLSKFQRRTSSKGCGLTPNRLRQCCLSQERLHSRGGNILSFDRPIASTSKVHVCQSLYRDRPNVSGRVSSRKLKKCKHKAKSIFQSISPSRLVLTSSPHLPQFLRQTSRRLKL